jgi:hypothetical protein
VKLRIHQRLHGVGNVFGCEWSAVRKEQPAAKAKRDSSAFLANFPGNGEAGLKGLSLPIQADQNAASEVANGFGSILLDQQWIESIRFAAETEMELATGLDCRLGTNEGRPAQNKGKSGNIPNAAHHCVTSCEGKIS